MRSQPSARAAVPEPGDGDRAFSADGDPEWISGMVGNPQRVAMVMNEAGDHAAICWPLPCGMARAKGYLPTADFISGREAERIGLVSLCVPRAELIGRALEVADRLGRDSQQAIRLTKRSLNGWLAMTRPIFDSPLAMEMMGFPGEDAAEGVACAVGRSRGACDEDPGRVVASGAVLPSRSSRGGLGRRRAAGPGCPSPHRPRPHRPSP